MQIIWEEKVDFSCNLLSVEEDTEGSEKLGCWVQLLEPKPKLGLLSPHTLSTCSLGTCLACPSSPSSQIVTGVVISLQHHLVLPASDTLV